MGSQELGSGELLDAVENLAVLREAIFRLFGENTVAIHFDFEDAATGGDKFGLDTKSGLDVSRQTGGTGFVVSNLTIFDGDLHDAGLFRLSTDC